MNGSSPETDQQKSNAQMYVDAAYEEAHTKKMRRKEEAEQISDFRDSLIQSIEANPLYQQMEQVMHDPVIPELFQRIWESWAPHRIKPTIDEIPIPVIIFGRTIFKWTERVKKGKREAIVYPGLIVSLPVSPEQFMDAYSSTYLQEWMPESEHGYYIQEDEIRRWIADRHNPDREPTKIFIQDIALDYFTSGTIYSLEADIKKTVRGLAFGYSKRDGKFSYDPLEYERSRLLSQLKYIQNNNQYFGTGFHGSMSLVTLSDASIAHMIVTRVGYTIQSTGLDIQLTLDHNFYKFANGEQLKKCLGEEIRKLETES